MPDSESETMSAPSVQVLANITPPEQFNFNNPASWPQWQKRFERYMSVSGQLMKPDDEKINILLYIMGEHSEEIIIQFPEIPDKYEDFLKAFANHFIPRRNIIFERFQFNSRVQLPGESINSYITTLHTLAEYCEYGMLKEELIRDKIVVGMSDKRCSEKMQLISNLTLADAVLYAKQAEIQNQQSSILKQDKILVNAVSSSYKNNSAASHSRNTFMKSSGENCEFCGFKKHAREVCPARNAVCRSCSKKGHWDRVCKGKKKFFGLVEHVNNEEILRDDQEAVNRNSDDRQFDNRSEIIARSASSSSKQGDFSLGDDYYLSNIFVNDKNQWMVNLFINSNFKESVPFLIDTGADIVCIPKKILDKTKLASVIPCNDTVSGPDGQPLKLFGKISICLTYPTEKQSYKCMAYVLNDLKTAILGRPGITNLGIFQVVDGRFSYSSLNTVCSIESSVNISQEFPNIFNEIGTFKDEMCIQVKSSAKPFVQSTPRTVPIPLMDKLEEEINRLLNLDIIVPVSEATTWVAPIVVVPKGDSVRLCCDYTALNKNVLRCHFPIPKVETSLAMLKDSKVFSKLDACSGFYQIKLSVESQPQPFTTFITPFGRYMFKRLPFGISCAPEYFSEKFSRLFSGVKGIKIHVDDILIHSTTIQEHDSILRDVLSRLHSEGITLNKSKCVIGVESVKFLGHIVSSSGIQIDPSRVEAIVKFPRPSNKKELQQLLGMIYFAGRFIPNKSEILEPLTSLLKNDVTFLWDSPQNDSFNKIKMLLSQAPCLAYYDPSKKIVVSADASSYGLGGALMQINEENQRELIAYASRTLSQTETRYAQIEREALSLTWSCEKFKEYLIGIQFVLETDHKPLLQILQTKNLDDLTPRLQRFRIRLMRYNYQVMYTPGNDLKVADALSRSPLTVNSEFEELSAESEAHVRMIVQHLPITDNFFTKIIKEQNSDVVCQKLKQFAINGWPEKHKLLPNLIPYYQYRYDISCFEELLLKGSRIIIPPSLQRETLDYIHSGHQGISKCRERAKMSVWWVGLSSDIENLVRSCSKCIEERTNIKETFVKDTIPPRPWQKVAVDLFKYNIWYLIITDYYLKFFEIVPLSSMTEQVVIQKLKEIFARFGIPEILRSDNGPQFQATFKKFSNDYNFQHVTSSPYFSQSNGCIEAAVKIAKSLLKKNDDINIALMSYRSTPLECGFSPAELMFSRKIRTLLPVSPNKLNEIVDTRIKFTESEERRKDKQEQNYNRRHNSKDLSELKTNDPVWISDLRKYGVIVEKTKEPRSYLVRTDNGTYRRNRWHLISAPHYKDSSNSSQNWDLIINSNLNTPVSQVHSDNQATPSQTNNNVDSTSEVAVPTSPDNANSQSNRPKRSLKKPAWLSDYVT